MGSGISETSPHARPGQIPANAWWTDLESLAHETQLHLMRTAAESQVPGYAIRELISRGGQGAVYSGVDEASGAPVAIKILRPALFSSESARRRFEREVEIVKELQHPNLVPVLRSGTTAAGLPFLVMPRIDGLAYDQWAAARRSNNLSLIVRVHAELCEAVHYAHQRGVIHRDLKPGNVLVDESDHPHVLDFGLAKPQSAIDHAVSAVTMTQEDQFVGSFPWASPEQLSGRRDAVDVRTDVYALGVMLYQALTGVFPYAVDGPLPTLVNSVMHVVPPPPSTHQSAIRPDWDAIVRKALAKSPDHRYPSAGEFAADLRQSLDGRASRARREQSTAALTRNIRRYQAIVGVSLTLLALSALLFFRANAARAQAEREAGKSRAAAKFLEDLFDAVNPSGDGVYVTVAKVLDRAAERVPLEFANEPEIAAGLHFMLGNAYGRLGLAENAQHYLRSYELRRAALGEDHPDTLTAAHYVARAELLPLSERFKLAERVLADRVRRLPPLHRDVILVRELHTLLLREMGDVRASVAETDELLDTAIAGLPPDSRALHNIMGLKFRREAHFGDLRRAIEWVDRLEAMVQENRDPEYEHRMAVFYYRTEIALQLERYDDAEAAIEAARAIRFRVFGDGHITSIATNCELALCRIGQGRLAEAEALMVASEAMHERRGFEILWRNQLRFVSATARLHMARGEFDQAIAVLQKWLEESAAITGGRSGNEQLIRCDLLATLVQCERWDAARSLAKKLLDYLQEQPLSLHLAARVNLDYAACLVEAGRGAEAAPLIESAKATLAAVLGPEHSWTRRAELMLRRN